MKTTLRSLFLAGLFAMSACAPSNGQSALPKILFGSPAFTDDAAIPIRHTCDGEGISPALIWINPPQQAQSFALTVTDPDASSSGFTHWVIYNIPGTARGLPEALSVDAQLPNGSIQGKNSTGQLGYLGPCPPSGLHHYVFELYALDTVLSLASGATKDELLSAMQGHVVGQGTLTGTYSKWQPAPTEG